MGSFSNYTELEILDHIFKVGSYTPATNLFIALCKSTIAEDDTGATLPTEVANSGAYARKRCNTWATAVGGATYNNMAITFTEATANWGTVTDFAVVDSGTYAQGNMLGFGKLTTAKKIGTGDTAKFATGDIDVTLD